MRSTAIENAHSDGIFVNSYSEAFNEDSLQFSVVLLSRKLRSQRSDVNFRPRRTSTRPRARTYKLHRQSSRWPYPTCISFCLFPSSYRRFNSSIVFFLYRSFNIFIILRDNLLHSQDAWNRFYSVRIWKRNVWRFVRFKCLQLQVM